MSQQEQQEPKVFENNNFKISVQEEPGCLVKLNVFVSPEQTNKNYKLAVKKINKEVSVPGFRKGKAPDSTVIRKLWHLCRPRMEGIISQ